LLFIHNSLAHGTLNHATLRIAALYQHRLTFQPHPPTHIHSLLF
jgi:hypothetical protein